MKRLGSVLYAFLRSRSFFVAIITALVAGSLSVTALMRGNSKPSPDQAKQDPSAEFWQEVANPSAVAPAGQPEPAGQQVEIQAQRFRAFTLNRAAMEHKLAAAPREFTAAARQATFILSLPNPAGDFERFAVQDSPVMESGLAEKHPDIRTYSGTGIDDRAASIRFDLTPLGFHASVRGPSSSWYIDPYYHLDQSVYVSYFRRDLENSHGVFVESDVDEASISADHSFYRPDHDVELSGLGFASRSVLTITISDRESESPTRQLIVKADENGAFDLKYLASLNGRPGTLDIAVTDGIKEASTTYDIFSRESPASPTAVGDQLRTYRLALLTDPGYATYFGGPANVTAAKVTLINRVTQVYEYDLSMRLVLIANNDLLNLDTAAQMTTANGPCGGAACYSASQATSCASATLNRNRLVIGLLVGASAFDIGHIALGQPGGGIASLGVVGGNNKAQGCTGVTTPTGDLFAVDYVAHEMGHQFSGNHTFNGTTSNCSTSNRNAGTSVEPGSGTSVMAYAGICGADNTQPHSDPYFSQRSFDEMTTYTSGAETNINEVQMGVLTGFNVDGLSFQLRYNGNDSAAIVRGTNNTTAGIKAAIEAISGWPAGGTVTVSALTDTGFTVTFSGGVVAATDVNQLSLVNFSGGVTGYANEIAKGGQTTRRGTVTATGNTIPTVTAPAAFTIPVRTPFALTASGFDADDDPLTYLWEQNDRGATGTTAGTALQSNTKLNGPLFRQFGIAANVSASDTLLYNSPGENPVTTDPTRVFPDMNQILANQTNALTGTCTAGDITCFSEFLPTASYVGVAGVNPLQLHFRVTVRDGRGGVNSNGPADTTLTLAPTAGPFLVTSPNTALTVVGGVFVVTWDVAGTAAAPVNATNVRILLSTDSGNTFPTVLYPSTPNDGSQTVAVMGITSTTARIKVEAVGNVFFDVSDTDFTISAPTAAPTSIGGTITTADGGPLAGVTVNLSGARNARAITDSHGTYRFTNLDAGSFCTVTPELTNYHFGPDSRSFSLLGNQTDAVFTATRDAVSNGNAIDTAGYFVRQHYLDFLGREPDASGFNFWSDQILGCGSDAGCRERRTINVSAAYFLSIEFQHTGILVDSLYRASYGRRPLFAEFTPDTATVANNVIVGSNADWQATLEANKQAFINAWLQRPAFRAAYDGLNSAAYVDSLISHAGGFNGDRDALVNGLNSGSLSRAAALRQIVENEGFVNAKRNQAFVMMQYFGYLRRDPDADGYQFWLNKLNQFNGNFEQAEMVKAFIVSGEYRNRFH